MSKNENSTTENLLRSVVSGIVTGAVITAIVGGSPRQNIVTAIAVDMIGAILHNHNILMKTSLETTIDKAAIGGILGLATSIAITGKSIPKTIITGATLGALDSLPDLQNER